MPLADPTVDQRRNLPNIDGVICLTTRPPLDLRPEQVGKIGQLQQISDPERAAARGHHHERVGVGDIGPARGQRAQLAPLVVVVDPVLAPVTAAGHELELPTEQRMERVGHPHDPPTRLIGCS